MDSMPDSNFSTLMSTSLVSAPNTTKEPESILSVPNASPSSSVCSSGSVSLTVSCSHPALRSSPSLYSSSSSDHSSSVSASVTTSSSIALPENEPLCHQHPSEAAQQQAQSCSIRRSRIRWHVKKHSTQRYNYDEDLLDEVNYGTREITRTDNHAVHDDLHYLAYQNHGAFERCVECITPTVQAVAVQRHWPHRLTPGASYPPLYSSPNGEEICAWRIGMDEGDVQAEASQHGQRENESTGADDDDTVAAGKEQHDKSLVKYDHSHGKDFVILYYYEGGQDNEDLFVWTPFCQRWRLVVFDGFIFPAFKKCVSSGLSSSAGKSFASSQIQSPPPHDTQVAVVPATVPSVKTWWYQTTLLRVPRDDENKETFANLGLAHMSIDSGIPPASVLTTIKPMHKVLDMQLLSPRQIEPSQQPSTHSLKRKNRRWSSQYFSLRSDSEDMKPICEDTLETETTREEKLYATPGLVELPLLCITTPEGWVGYVDDAAEDEHDPDHNWDYEHNGSSIVELRRKAITASRVSLASSAGTVKQLKLTKKKSTVMRLTTTKLVALMRGLKGSVKKVRRSYRRKSTDSGYETA